MYLGFPIRNGERRIACSLEIIVGALEGLGIRLTGL
jgi:hypothetical protein